MAAVEIGVGLRGFDRIPESAGRAEELGFDYVFSGEHVFFHGPSPNAFITLALAAGATSRIKLLSAVTLLPLYPAALVAKLASVLDVSSGGRFNLGVGVGGEFPPEFEAVGVPTSERGQRTNEALELIRELFEGGPVSFEGRWARVSGLELRPPPVQPGGPPVWVAGRRTAAMRRAARWGDVWMPYLYTPEQLAESLETVRVLAAENGREPDAVRGSIYAFTTVYEDGGQARRIARETVGGGYNQDFSRFDRYLVAGTAEECVTRLNEYREAGASTLQLSLSCPADDHGAMVERVANEVVPALRAAV